MVGLYAACDMCFGEMELEGRIWPAENIFYRCLVLTIVHHPVQAENHVVCFLSKNSRQRPNGGLETNGPISCGCNFYAKTHDLLSVYTKHILLFFTRTKRFA